MKKYIISLILSAITVHAEPYLIDTNTPHVVGGSIIYGDPLPTAFTKVNLDVLWLQNYCATNSLSNAALFTVVGSLQTNFLTLSNSFNSLSNRVSTYFSGTNIWPGTINTTRLDVATMTWLNGLGGSGGSMNFDGGTITSDGGGTISANYFRGGFQDNTSSTGPSGYVPKANGDGTWTWTAALTGTTMNFDSGTITSDGSGNITAPSIQSRLSDSGGSQGTTYGYIPVSMGDGTWMWGAGVVVTNTVTVYDFTNHVLSSRQVTTYSTNNITWATSNFLARVTGLYSWSVNFGQLGGGGLTPATNVAGDLFGSLNGSNGWFTITNGYRTTNDISVAAVGAGGGLGNATLYSIDQLPLLSRTNYFFGQYMRFDSPVDGSDAATKTYVDNQILAVKSGNFVSYTDTNGTGHFSYSVNNVQIMDLWNAFTFIPLVSFSLSGTNVLMVLNQTNLTTGYTIQSTTNLLNGSAGWMTFTNYTLSTNTGLVTFTMPIKPGESQRFWRALASSAFGVNLPQGTIYPSNTWNYAAITNQMGIGSIWTGNSNGQPVLVSLWKSNAAQCYYLVPSNGVTLKVPAP